MGVQISAFLVTAPNNRLLVVSAWHERIWKYYLVQLVLELAARFSQLQRGMQFAIGYLEMTLNLSPSFEELWQMAVIRLCVGTLMNISFICFFGTWFLLSSIPVDLPNFLAIYVLQIGRAHV